MNQVKESNFVTVEIFTGSNCPGCSSLKKKIKGSLPYKELNVENKENMMKASHFGIRSLPTTILFQHNLPIETLVGDVGLNKIKEEIKRIKGELK